VSGRDSTGSRSMRYHAWWGTWLGEEVSDGTHADNRGGGNRGGVAPTAPPLRLRAGALRGSGLCRI
jgi:hypothetical protein